MAEARLQHLDVLRGLALLGICLVHFSFWFSAGPLPDYAPDALSRALLKLLDTFVSNKAYALFAFLFGVSFYLQMSSYGRRERQPDLRMAWRLALLLAMGAVHSLLWLGDILSIFALLGFALIALRRCEDEVLLPLAFALVFNVPGLCWDLFVMIEQIPPGDPLWPPAQALAYLKLMQHGGLGELMRFHVEALPVKAAFQLGSGRLSVTLGMFALGWWVARQGWLHDPVLHKRELRWMLAGGVLVQLAMMLVAIVSHVLAAVLGSKTPLLGLVGALFGSAHTAGMVAIYVAGACLLLQQPAWQARLAWFAPAGQMSLSNYLAQSLVGLLLFYGIGLGLAWATTPATNLLLGLICFGALAYASRWWLQSHRHGPLEWAWRSATALRAVDQTPMPKT